MAGRLHRVRQRLERQEFRHEAADALVAAQLRVRQARWPQRAAHLCALFLVPASYAARRPQGRPVSIDPSPRQAPQGL